MLFGGEGAAISGDEATLEGRISDVLQYIRFSGVDICQYLNAHVLPKIRSNCHLMWQEKWLGQTA